MGPTASSIGLIYKCKHCGQILQTAFNCKTKANEMLSKHTHTHTHTQQDMYFHLHEYIHSCFIFVIAGLALYSFTLQQLKRSGLHPYDGHMQKYSKEQPLHRSSSTVIVFICSYYCRQFLLRRDNDDSIKYLNGPFVRCSSMQIILNQRPCSALDISV